jgi:hypothetical protein
MRNTRVMPKSFEGGGGALRHLAWPKPEFVNFKEPRNRSHGIDSASLCSLSRICKPFKEPRSRFPAWRAGTTTLFHVPARQATYAGGIDSLRSIPFRSSGSGGPVQQIRLSYRPATRRLHRLAETIPWNRFRAS